LFVFGLLNVRSLFKKSAIALNFVTQHLDNKQHVISIFLDIAKAFDSMDHIILLRKLDHYGIRGLALDWFHSYLSHRFQYVVSNGTTSFIHPVSSGIPQGSLLGPIIFILFINDLPNCASFIKYIMYADDTTLLLSDSNLSNLYHNANSALSLAVTWFEDNRLNINAAKTNYLLFSSLNYTVDQYSLLLNNMIISRKPHVKFLGVILDDKLNWKEHINCLSIKLSHDIAMLSVAKYCLPRSCLLMLYYAFFYSHITYALILWGNASVEHIYTLQRRAIKIIANLPLYVHLHDILSIVNTYN
jgi:hypothetical protein